MTQTEALRLALEALKEDRAWLETDAPTEVWEKNNEAITAIKAALLSRSDGEAQTRSVVKDEPVFHKPHLDIEGPLHVVCRCPVCKAQPQQEAKDEPVACWCHKCNENKLVNGIPFAMTRMILCPNCGNKRCPKASDHTLQCTNSNEPNQAGSVYATPPPVAEPHKRTWVGLTDEEIVLIVAECAASHQHTDIHFARAIEAKLKEKNI